MLTTNPRRNSEKTCSYATAEDFHKLFTAEINDFFRLSLQLTASVEKAERCLILAMKDCSRTQTIFRDFTRTWARRMVIRNAIHLIQSDDLDTACDSQTSGLQNESQARMAPVLRPAEFDRLAFVICAVEHLCVQDCALLLRKSPKDVNEAIVRAGNPNMSGVPYCRASFDISDSRHTVQGTLIVPPFIFQGLAS
jgi:hypothetical protein